MVRTAKVLALSNSTSLIGGGTARSGLEAAMTVLKYWKISSCVIWKGRLLQMILRGWFSAIAQRVFSSGVRSGTAQRSEERASSLIFSSSISLGRSLSLFFFFFFFLSFSTRVPYSSFWMTVSLGSRAENCMSWSISQTLIISILTLAMQGPACPPPPSNCLAHHLPISSVCRSHLCDYYRQLCPKCVQQDSSHANHHLEMEDAIRQALKLGRRGLKGLQAVRARKNQEMEVNINNNPGLFEIESKLDEIRKLINEKVDNFHANIKRIYAEHVKEKLDELDEVIEKSEQLLQGAVGGLEQGERRQLRLFFRNDFIYELKYYQSYFNEIFVKKIRYFKTALESDRILTLVTTFEQNLEKIFTFSKETPLPDSKLQQFHLFYNDNGHCYLYTLSQNLEAIRKQSLASMNKITHTSSLPEKKDYEWQGNPESVYYPPGNCYYIIGEGNKSSRLILKYDVLKGVDEGFRAVRSMETERCRFGVCILGGEIYVIGGENEKDGCLSRCEKIVPLTNNQIYIIHSLNQRSSRHSVTTYKDKYILKFGGIRKIPPFDRPISPQNQREYLACPEIYSIQTEEWSIIPIKEDISLQFHLYPTFFKAQQRNLFLVLGGDSLVDTKKKYRPAFEVVLQESKGEIDQMKIRVRQSKIEYREKVYNTTISLQDQENTCVFLKSRIDQEGFELGRFKVQL